MEFADRLKSLAANIPSQRAHINTEEATKTALVMPFINALGYNVFDPTEVVPELTADVGTKKGEKVDYAILRDARPIILFECKCYGADLSNVHASQLFRYFTVTEARFAVLTNGVEYRFYTDLDEANKMDPRPFFVFRMDDITDTSIEQLRRFSKSAFAEDQIIGIATEWKYMSEIKGIMAEQLADPSDDFVRLLASRVYPGRMTQTVRQQFGNIVARALQEFIADRVNDRLRDAMVVGRSSSDVEGPAPTVVDSPGPDDEASAQPRVVTTDEEREAYLIVKAILREVVAPERVAMRDAATYCSVLLDDNNRKPICRLWFNGPRKYIGLFDAQKQEQRQQLGSLNDILTYAEQLKAAVGYYA